MKKKLTSILLLTVLIFSVIPQAFATPPMYPGTITGVTVGDILVTSDTSSSGLTGHAAIVVSGTEYVEIKGAGYHPQKGLLTTWFSNHAKKIRIMGHNNFTESQNAGNWALNFFNNYSTVTYDIDDLYQYNKTTYCSKIVWDAYHFGAGIDLDTASFNIGNVFVPYWITIVTPYSLLHTTHNNYLKYANDSNW